MEAPKKIAQAKEISVSEFFEKNRHLLGYDNKIKALLMVVKEAVDNGLDAAEEARILPDIYVKIEELEKEKYRVVVSDNGPGIVKKQIPRIFGKLLYGSKFHRLRQSRGQQGLGISVGVLYSQLTTGHSTEIVSSIGDGKTHHYRLKVDVKHNEPKIEESAVAEGKEWHGVRVGFICEGLYREHKQSVLEYLKQTAISNPYANITFDSPTGRMEFKRAVEELPKEPRQIKPHLYGTEIGILSRMLHETNARTLLTFLTSEFTRIGRLTGAQIINKAGITYYNEKTGKEEPGLNISPRKISDEQVSRLVKAAKEIRLTRPPTDCLSPLGGGLIEEGIKKELNPEFVAAVTRPPAVYRGWPFIIECGIAYGGSIEEPKIMRLANRVPLLYQAGDCAITKSIQAIDWRRYGIESEKLPTAPVVIMVHMASVWVPFTSESKESIASYTIIIKEIKLALQECARRLSIYLSGVRKAQWQSERKSIFERYADETANAIHELTGKPPEGIRENLLQIIQRNIKRIEAVEKQEEALKNTAAEKPEAASGGEGNPAGAPEEKPEEMEEVEENA